MVPQTKPCCYALGGTGALQPAQHGRSGVRCCFVSVFWVWPKAMHPEIDTQESLFGILGLMKIHSQNRLSHESYPQHPALFNQDPDVSTPPYWSLVHRALAPPEWVIALYKELAAAPPSQRFDAGALKSAGETSVSQRYLLF